MASPPPVTNAHDSPASAETTDQPIAPKIPAVKTPFTLMACMMENLGLYSATKLDGYLATAKEQAEEADRLAAKDKRQVEHLKKSPAEIIRNILLGSDPFDLSDAEEAAEACKKLWFAHPQSVMPEYIEPRYLQQLANGIRNGALDKAVIKCHLFRFLIVIFCLKAHERDERSDDTIDVNSMIQEVYQTTISCRGEKPTPEDIEELNQAAFTTLAEYGARLMELIGTLERMIKQHREELLGSSEAPSPPRRDISDLIKSLITCTDTAEVPDAARQVNSALLYQTETIHTFPVLKRLVERARRHTRMMNAFLSGEPMDSEDEFGEGSREGSDD